MTDRSTALGIQRVSKAFHGTQALDDVSLEIAAGEIHALLGGNGSGKSTLIKILAGVHEADRGTFVVEGVEHSAGAWSTSHAKAAGLHFVHQQLATFPGLTIAENIAIGRGFETGGGGRVRWREQRRRAARLLQRFEISAKPNDRLESLSASSQTMLAIARALQDQEDTRAGILFLDEPTASLPAHEVSLLLSALKRYAEQGQTIIYVTHRLDEALAAADRATILRDGRLVATVETKEVDHERLAELIMGRKLGHMAARSSRRSRGRVALRAESVRGGAVRGASFSLHAGEVLGIAGLLGSGRSSLLRLIFGAARLESGQLELGGERCRLDTPGRAVRAGIAYVPEDRHGEATFNDLSVTENLGITAASGYFRWGITRRRSERRDTRRLMGSYLIKAHSPLAPLSSLSGGNQQKVILARWLRREPRILLLDEPTQGVDIGARMELWGFIRAAVDAGAAALVVSSDFEELPRACDRALIMRNGTIVDELAGGELSQPRLDEVVLAGVAPR